MELIKEKTKISEGEKKFLERLSKEHLKVPETKKEAQEYVKSTISKIREEIENLPEIKKEKSFHPEIEISDSLTILTEAFNLALKEGVEEAIKEIYKKNPWAVDAFHDLLVGHFSELWFKNKKPIKIMDFYQILIIFIFLISFGLMLFILLRLIFNK
jgi:hypothetical protein